MGQLGDAKQTKAKPWAVLADTDHLQWLAETWSRRMTMNPQSNRLFLSVFALYLERHFQVQEERIAQTQPANRAWHQMEHARLMSGMRQLMRELESGLDVGPAIQRFLDDWRAYLLMVPREDWRCGHGSPVLSNSRT